MDDFGNGSPMYWSTEEMNQHFGSLGVYGFYVIENDTADWELHMAMWQESVKLFLDPVLAECEDKRNHHEY